TDGLTKTVTYVPGTGSQMNDGSGWISDDGRFLYIGARTTGSFDIHRFEFLIPGDLNSLQSSGASDRLLNIPSASSHGSVSSGTPDGLTIYVHTGAESTINAIRLPAPNDIANGALDPTPITVAPSGVRSSKISFGQNGRK